jgi:putative acetyltransferase
LNDYFAGIFIKITMQKMENTITIRTILPTDNPILAKIIRDVFIEHDAPQHGTVYSDPTTDDLYQ